MLAIAAGDEDRQLGVGSVVGDRHDRGVHGNRWSGVVVQSPSRTIAVVGARAEIFA